MARAKPDNVVKKRGRPHRQTVETHNITKDGIIVGYDKKVIHPDEVRKLAALGCSKKDIAAYLGIQADTLVYNFNDEYIQGFEEMKVCLRRSMFDNACKNNSAPLQIFLAKNYLGMKDIPDNNESNAPLPWNTEEVK